MKISTILILPLLLALTACAVQVQYPISHGVLTTPLNGNGQTISNVAGVYGINGQPLTGGTAVPVKPGNLLTAVTNGSDVTLNVDSSVLTSNSPIAAAKVNGKINLTNLPPNVDLLPTGILITNAMWTNAPDISVHDGVVFIPTSSTIGQELVGAVLKPATNTASTVFWPFASTPFNNGDYGAYPNAGFVWNVVQGTSEGGNYIQTYFSAVPNGYTDTATGSQATRFMVFNYDPTGVFGSFIRISQDIHFWGAKIDMEGGLITNAVYQGTFIGDGSGLVGISGSGGADLVSYAWNEFSSSLYPETPRISGVFFSTGNLQNNIAGENVQTHFNRDVTFTNEIFSWGANTGPITNGQSITISFATNNPATASVSDDFTDTGFGVTIQGNGSSFAQTNTGTKSFTLPAGVAVVRKVTYHGPAGFTSSFTSNGQRTP